MKKIIIILSLVILILIGVLFIIGTFAGKSAPTGNDPNLPTGIIVPKSEQSENKLDIVQIDPSDQQGNIAIDKKITITFNKPFTRDEVEFTITPNTPHSFEIQDNKMIISPATNWENGTLYTYFFNFENDDEQVRLYRFTTTGPTSEFLPDTQTEGLYEEVLNEQKVEHPDTYVANNTPFENAFFSIRTDFDPNPPAHNYFIVTQKTENEEEVQQAVNVWLQQLDLSTEQIQSLDIRYE